MGYVLFGLTIVVVTLAVFVSVWTVYGNRFVDWVDSFRKKP